MVSMREWKRGKNLKKEEKSCVLLIFFFSLNSWMKMEGERREWVRNVEQEEREERRNCWKLVESCRQRRRQRDSHFTTTGYLYNYNTVIIPPFHSTSTIFLLTNLFSSPHSLNPFLTNNYKLMILNENDTISYSLISDEIRYNRADHLMFFSP